MTHYEKIKQIANHYGFRHQAIKTTEECSELAVVMAKYVLGQAGRSAVVDELADVTIMKRQMQYLMKISRAELDQAIENKVNRQLERMKNEKSLDKSKKRSIIKNHQSIEKLLKEIEWYQELYDKSRRDQIRCAEEAEALRAENDRLRAALQQDRRHKRRGA